MIRRPALTVRPELTVLEDRLAPNNFGIGAAFGSGFLPDHSSHGSYLADSVLAGSPLGDNGNGNVNILPASSDAFGASYGQWSASWWQWAFSMPTASNNLLDTAAANANQSGHVWYIGGSFTNVQTETRDLSMPAGTALFFPVVNQEVDNIGGGPSSTSFQGTGLTDAQLRVDAGQIMDQTLAAATPFAKIDGVSVSNLGQYRVQSPVFTITMPADNLYGTGVPQTSHAVSDGIYLMVPPLSVGHHTIEIGATLPAVPGQPQSFSFDITYNINVTPGHGS